MGNVSVSRESLEKIKIELGNFQTSMESSTEHMKAHAEEVVVGVRNAIKKQQSLVTTLEKAVTKLAGEIEHRQAQIINNNNKLNTLASNIAAGKAQSSGMDQQISQLQSRKQQLISLGSASSDNGGNDNSGQINAIENQIRECDNQRRRLNEQIASMQRQQNELNRKNDQLRDEKVRKEAELSTAKGELNKAREKNEKMKSAGAMVESKIGDLLGVVQHFKQTVTTTSSTSKSGIEKCITAIDEYEAVNINGSVHDSAITRISANTTQELRQMADMDSAGEFELEERHIGQPHGITTSSPASGTAYSAQVMSCPAGPEGYHYEEDDNHRHHVYGQLSLVPDNLRSRRNAYAQRIAGGSNRRSDDEGGHLIGHRFGGDGSTHSPNLFPQNRSLNRRDSTEGSGSYVDMEDEWERLLESGNRVYVDIYASSASSHAREDSIYGSYTVVRPDGSQYTETFEFTNENTSTQDSWSIDNYD